MATYLCSHSRPTPSLPLNMGQFNGPVLTIDFADGYIIAVLQNSHTFQVLGASKMPWPWSGLGYIATLSYFPDNIVSMILRSPPDSVLLGEKESLVLQRRRGLPPSSSRFRAHSPKWDRGRRLSITQADEIRVLALARRTRFSGRDGGQWLQRAAGLDACGRIRLAAVRHLE